MHRTSNTAVFHGRQRAGHGAHSAAQECPDPFPLLHACVRCHRTTPYRLALVPGENLHLGVATPCIGGARVADSIV